VDTQIGGRFHNIWRGLGTVSSDYIRIRDGLRAVLQIRRWVLGDFLFTVR